MWTAIIDIFLLIGDWFACDETRPIAICCIIFGGGGGFLLGGYHCKIKFNHRIEAEKFALEKWKTEKEIKNQENAVRLELCRQRREEREREFEKIVKSYQNSILISAYEAIKLVNKHRSAVDQAEINLKSIYEELMRTLQEYDRRKKDRAFARFLKTTKFGTAFLDYAIESEKTAKTLLNE